MPRISSRSSSTPASISLFSILALAAWSYVSIGTMAFSSSIIIRSERSNLSHFRRNMNLEAIKKKKPTKTHHSKIKSNEAVLNSLEDEPSSDSLAHLRESATARIASFLSTFSNEREAVEEEEKEEDSDLDDSSSDVNGTAGNIQLSTARKQKIQWDVYVCQSKPCKERGASATLDAFQTLAPPDQVHVYPAYLHKTKAKGPNIRCIPRTVVSTSNNNGATMTTVQNNYPQAKNAFEVNNVNDIDKVYRILTEHMGITNISVAARDCLKYTYRGNAHLERNELSDAISSYNAALDTGYDHPQQEGIVLLLRATAYLKRAFQHQEELRRTVQDLAETVPDPKHLGQLYNLAAQHPSLSKVLFQRVLEDTKRQDGKFRQTKFHHGLYEYALLHAAQDALRSTQILPNHAKTWLRAGDALAELRKLKESAMYYEKAIELDPTLKDRLEPVIERLERSQRFLDKAKKWWSSDTLRLALDVAG